MAELPEIFDLFYPSPPPLKDLACIRVALDIWMKKFSEDSDNFDLKLDSILPLNTVIPNAPSSILPDIEKYAEKLINSINQWLTHHNEKGITQFSYQIFHRFTDFVCDYDGTIDCEKTARKMIQSDAFSDEEKFKIACEYGFVDDIERIWQHVCATLYENNVDLQRNRMLCYWIWRFRGQLYKMEEFVLGGPAATDDVIFNQYVHNDYWCGVDYFCNHFDLYSLDRKALAIFQPAKKKIFRYMLVKLNEAQLQQWANTDGILVLRKMLENNSLNFVESTFLALQIWSYVKHVMTEDAFIQLVRVILNTDKSNSDGRCAEAMSSWNEIWSSASNYLKQSVIPDVLLGTSSARVPSATAYYGFTDVFRNVSFLLTILKDFPVQFRRDFWYQKWKSLLINMDLEKIRTAMNMCFTNQNEIEQFKKRNMTQFENIRPYCSSLLKRACFQELFEYLRFCCTDDEQTIRNLSRSLLQSDFKWAKSYVNDCHALNDFVSFAFADVDAKLACQFRNIHINPGKIILPLLRGVDTCPALGFLMYAGGPATFKQIMDFVDTFETSKENATNLKKNVIVPHVRVLLGGNIDEGFLEFINWCLENEDEIATFKASLNLDEIIQAQIRREVTNSSKSQIPAQPFGYESGREGLSLGIDQVFGQSQGLKSATDSTGGSFLATFIRWYCVTAEEVEAVVRRYADDRVFVRLFSM